ncbi:MULTISPECIES: methionine adenosyltransferase [Acidiphilium]|uniref:S-adenosylmethionine synthase n=1 Tax=Acidiphilium multivorum (strain DSM 11245 / JCM 8867 / NBRC 100883 / AIU 301) TaxID=926570 RepID=F0J5D5_ACIMA|nr:MULTISPECIES: methionine adenosyltransferase [Acidiphilium]MBU6357395.1 methionine adenosyltransferase [Rhodospirillales bacterium]EGO95532.1 S-adenosylmethionine synthetase [Acidiphilium sp. PM]KDM66116.1 S-adenosylmethionine synthase MetK [Acidiphilium sp. JA12-A1]MBS3022329.1 methionine adenosyltransferase [Acidiphilium multivorum]MDE2328308.1 methionine adenosyltransferase [Rhodospirillales bacterium]
MRDKGDYLFTSESVSEGHPDKVADRISDTVLDAFLAADPYARVACETLVTTNRIVLAGETRGPSTITREYLAHLARLAVHDIGYEQEGFSWRDAKIDVLLHEQSADIAAGVDAAGNKDEGAGDQGIMFGYACSETDALMPAPIYYAHLILRRMTELRKIGDARAAGLLPDAKSQVTLRYADGKPVGTTSIVVSTQHEDGMSQDEIKAMLRPLVTELLPDGWMCPDDQFYVNPTGKFVIGGPDGDCGLTGRKIIVDTYGGAAPHGGGAFSGKDPTKVDRSAAYMCRYLAKNVVAAGLATRCTIQVSYAIGVSHPLSVYVDMHGTERDVDHARLETVLRELVNLTPRGIREHLHLNRPIYVPTSAYGHFGREPDDRLGTFTWEKTDLAPALKAAFGR